MKKKVSYGVLALAFVISHIAYIFAPVQGPLSYSGTARAAGKESEAGRDSFKTRELIQDKVYLYDLDQDGKKEKIKYTVINDDDEHAYKLETILYINGEECYRKKMDYAVSAQYTIADIDTDDHYLDLFLMVTSDSYCFEFAAFQQYQSKRIKTVTSSLKNKNLRYIRGYEIGAADGKGHFKATIDTPFNMEAIGCYYSDIPFVMEKGKVKRRKASTYSLAPASRKFQYIPLQEVKVFEKADTSSKQVRTIKKGEAVTILKIKPITAGYDFKKRASISGYACIEDKNGKKGWIYIDKKYNWNHPLFKEIPQWG